MTRRPPHRSRRAVCSHRALPAYARPPSGRDPGSGPPGRGAPTKPWSRDLTARAPLLIASPGVTAPVATPMAPLLQEPHGAEDALVEAGNVAVAPVVVVVPPALGLEPRQQPPPTLLSGRLAPWGDARQRGPARRPRGPAVELVLPLPSLPPAQLAPQPLDAGLGSRWVPTKRAHSRLLRRQLPSDVSEPLASRLGEACGVCLLLTRPHTIVGVSEPARLSSTASRAPRLEPPIEGIGPGHRREAR